MPAKSQTYLEQYSAARRAASTYDAVVRDIRDERQQLQALQQLIQSERNTLAQLEAGLATERTSQGIADEVLKATYSSEALAAQLAAQTSAAGAAARAVPREVVSLVEKANADGDLPAGDANRAGMLAVSLLGRADRPLTQQAADATLAYLEALPNLPARTLQRARQAAGRVAQRPTRGPGAPALTPEQAAQEAGRQRALEAVYHSSPLGYVGAFEGEAIAKRRRSSPAPDDTSFATADDALTSYLDMLEDGIASAEELARITGTPPEQAERDFRFAKGVYADAKAVGAYQNRQRKYFEPSWLSQAARVTQLQRSLQQATPEVQRSVSEEAARRVLQQRGLDPDDKYLSFRGTPKYDYLRAADRIYAEVPDELVPSTKVQRSVATLLDQYESTNTPWKLDDLAAQLGKTLSGDELAEAVGFGLAYDRQRREGVTPANQRELQEQERQRIEAADKARKDLRREVEADFEAARSERDNLEASLLRDFGRQLSTGQEQQQSLAALYARARVGGMTPEQARVTVDPFYVPPAEVAAELGKPAPRAPGKDISPPEADFTLRGAVVPPEDATADNGPTADELKELLERYGKRSGG